MSNYKKKSPVGIEWFHVNGRTDRHDEANSQSPFAILRTRLKTRYVHLWQEFSFDYTKLRDKQVYEEISNYVTYSSGTDI
jgi:hypothetical protein